MERGMGRNIIGPASCGEAANLHVSYFCSQSIGFESLQHLHAFFFFNVTSLCVRDVIMSMYWNTSWFDLKIYLTSTVKKKKGKPKPNAQVFGLFKSYFDQVSKTRSSPCNGQKNLGNRTTENCQLSDLCSMCVCVCEKRCIKWYRS